MPFQAIVYRIMIASPSDVQQERDIIRKVINEWNEINSVTRSVILLPVGWETHASPALGDTVQNIINQQVLKDCDILIGVFWTRIGTKTDDFESGSVEEIERHIEQKKPAMIYFSEAPIKPSSLDKAQYELLGQFKNRCDTLGLYEKYASTEEFESKFRRHLQIEINKEPYFNLENNTFAHDSVSTTILSNEEKIILKEGAADLSGHIVNINTFGGYIIQTNGKQLVPDSSPKVQASWADALIKLEKRGLIRPTSEKKDIFTITHNGFAVAETL